MVFWNWWTKLFLIYTTWHRTNFPPAEKFDRTVRSSGTVRYFQSVYTELLERFSYDLRMFRYSKVFVICFISQWMKRSKHDLYVFPPKKTLIWRRHSLIGQSCCSMTSKRSIGWFLGSSPTWTLFTRFYQPKAMLVCIRSINQSSRSISVRLLFLFCSRVFISRSYENRSKQN